MEDVHGARNDTIARWRSSAQVIVGGGLLIAVLIVLTVSVVLVSNESKHPLVQRNPPAPTSSAPTPSPTVAAGPIPLPATTTEQPPPADNPTAPVEAMPPSQLTAETMAPDDPPRWRHRRHHELFPFPFWFPTG
jgi:hypothetical protein